jgi:hypothetical protein
MTDPSRSELPISTKRKITAHGLIGVKGRCYMAKLECGHHETANKRELRRGWLYCFTCRHNLAHARAFNVRPENEDRAMRTGNLRP